MDQQRHLLAVEVNTFPRADCSVVEPPGQYCVRLYRILKSTQTVFKVNYQYIKQQFQQLEILLHVYSGMVTDKGQV